MYKSNKILLHPADFDNAMLFQDTVSIWMNGEILDFGGPIEKHTEDFVYINGGHYVKANCEFKVRS